MEKFGNYKSIQTYYNNGYYKTGWEYENQIVGTPLFVNRSRGQHYFNDIKPFDWPKNSSSSAGNNNILFVRVFGGHTGFILNILQNQHLIVSSKSMITYTQSYKSRNPTPNYRQLYTLQEFQVLFKKVPLLMKFAAGYDRGEFTNNFGGQLGLNWRIMDK